MREKTRTSPDEKRKCQVLDDRARQKSDRPSWGSKPPISVDAEKGMSGDGGYEVKDREGSATPDLETSVVAKQCKTEEMKGDGEESEVESGEGT